MLQSSLKILQSLIIGLSIAVIPGPIFFELIRRTLTKGLLNGVLLVIGEFVGNFVLLLLIFFGLSPVLINPIVKSILTIMGGSILLKLGIFALQLKKEEVSLSYDKKINAGKSFLSGFGIAVTSPIVIALWISLSGSYLSVLHNNFLSFFHIFLIAFGFLLFFLPLAIIVHYTRHRIPPKYVVYLSRVFGTVLIMYAAVLFYGLIKG